VADARSLPEGAAATIEGVLTTDLGILESGRSGFVQDQTGGIALYLDAAAAEPLPAGALIVASGTVSERYGQRTLRLSLDDVVSLGPALQPTPIDVATGAADEAWEGWRVHVRGAVVESPTAMADGIGIMIDDGSGPLRVVAGASALEGRTVSTGMLIEAIGPLGQRDSSGTGAAGYRVLTMGSGELTIAEPSPSPSPAPSASPSPSGSPSPSPSASIDPSPLPTPGSTIEAARQRPTGSFVRVAGIVTAEAGALGKPPLLAIEDETAGIVIHLPDGVRGWPRGTSIVVAGRLASVYGQLELRPAAADIAVGGAGEVPEALPVRALDLGERLEARLLTLTARVTASPTKGTSGDLSIDVADADGKAARIGVDASLGIARETFVRGHWYVFTGVEGQHASRTGALDGYRLWIRDRADVATTDAPLTSGNGAAPTAATGGTAGNGTQDVAASGSLVLTIASALRTPDVELTVEGVITAGTELLDASRRRVVLQDGTGAVEVLLPAPATLGPGTRLRVAGTIGRAYDAPRLRAEQVVALGSADLPPAIALSKQPDASLEWRLARMTGTVERTTRVGEAWRSDVSLGGTRILVIGLAGAGIPSTRLAVGTRVTLTGIVRRPYPSASDRRFAIVPRSSRDIARLGTDTSASASGAARRAVIATDAESTAALAGRPELVDLARLGEYEGRTVGVAGLVTDRLGDELWLDDGTGRSALILGPAVLAAGIVTAVGQAVEASGVVAVGPDGAVLKVDDPTALILAGMTQPVVAIAPAASPRGQVLHADRLDGAPASDPPLPLPYATTLGLVGLLLPVGWAVRRGVMRRASTAIVRRRLAAITTAASPSLPADPDGTAPQARSRTGDPG
jgi:hypothetical protein